MNRPSSQMLQKAREQLTRNPARPDEATIARLRAITAMSVTQE